MINDNILKSCGNKGYNKEELYGAYKIFFGTLVSEPRIKIINLLRKKKANVSQIVKELKMNQTSVSHNLKRLKTCGFVKSEIVKKYRYYSLNKDTIHPLMNIIDKHMTNHCIQILKDMKGDKEK